MVFSGGGVRAAPVFIPPNPSWQIPPRNVKLSLLLIAENKYMFKSWIRIALVAFTAAAFLSGVFRGATYDTAYYGDIRALFRTEGCDSPCFMGVLPGETTAEEAIALLQAHPWVAEVHSERVIEWQWNGAQPTFIVPASIGQVHVSGGGVVRNVQVQTLIPLRDIWAAVGHPPNGLIDLTGAGARMDYPRTLQEVIGATRCPVSPTIFSETHVRMQWNQARVSAYIDPDYLRYWQRNTLC